MIQRLLENRWGKWWVALGSLLFICVGTLYIAGYIYLWHIKQPPYTATPFTVISYWHYYGHLPHVESALAWCLLGAGIPTAGSMLAFFLPTARSLYGDASFAKRKDMEKAELFAEKGLILGKFGGEFITLKGQQGALLEAPPRSGKGVGAVQPNMLNWTDSVVAVDIRQESWRITSGFRAKFSKTFLFNPVSEDGSTCQWNPLTYVSDDPVLRINDIQKIANMLSPDPPEGDPFWPASCRTLFLGLALYVFETPGLPRTFGEIVRQIMFGEGETVGEHWKNIIEERDESDNPLSQPCKSALYDFIMTSGNTQSSIRKTFTAKLELWLNPLVDQATSGDSFDLRRLRKERISCYVGVRPADLGRLQLLINLFFQQIIDLNTDEMPEDNPDLKYQLMLMLDEMTAIGRMRVFEETVSFLGGFNIRPFVIIQGRSQLRATYGADRADTIVTCLAAVCAYAPKDLKQAKEISELLGDTTVEAKSKSKPLGFLTKSMGSTNVSDAARPLLKPQEVRDIGKGRMFIFVENVKPILCDKVVYHKERVFRVRYHEELGFFRKRRLPPANVPKLGRPTIQALKKPEKKVVETVRDITPSDVENLDKLSLADFNIKFEDIDVPKGPPVSEEEMKAAVGSFLDTMMD